MSSSSSDLTSLSASLTCSLSDTQNSSSQPPEHSSSSAIPDRNDSTVECSSSKKRRSVAKQDPETVNSSTLKRHKGAVNGDSLINKLTIGELQSTLQGYLSDYNVDTDEQGCKRLGTKKFSQKTLARKSDGYLQICVRGVSKETKPARYKELFGGLDKQILKVLIHQLAWRVKHEVPIPDDTQICHTCSSTDCFNDAHLICGSRVLNESHKLCKYVYTRDEVSGKNNTYLLCQHVPKCHPPLKAYPLQLVAANASMEFLTESPHEQPVNKRSLCSSSIAEASSSSSFSSQQPRNPMTLNTYFKPDKSSPLSHSSSH